MCCVEASLFLQMSPTLNRRSEIQYNDAIEIHGIIMFVLYAGLPHMHFCI